MHSNDKEIPDKRQYNFSELVDVPAFARMMENFFVATGIPNGLVDANGELLSMSGGKNVCAVFHRTNPKCAEHCRESNVAVMHDLRQGHVAGVLCKNGLMDYATPVVIEGRALATLFIGQFLHQSPDMTYFRAQAKRFGFDEKAYLASIAATPVIDKTQAESLMKVMVEIASMLASSGLARLRQVQMEHDFNEYTERRIQLEDILDFSPVAIGWSNVEGRIEFLNRQFVQLFGYTLDDLPDLDAWYRLAYPDEHYRNTTIQPWMQNVALARKEGAEPPELEANVCCKNGAMRRIVIRVSWVGERRLVSFADISERWMSEKRMNAHDAMLEMVARGDRLTGILNAIVQQVESEDKTTLCSILLLDEEGKHLLNGAAPSLPEFYTQAIHGIEIGMGVGSCGTAAYLGKRVIVEDILTHEYWKPYIQLTQKAGLRSCWSEPILSSRGKVLGTFAVYHAEPKIPQANDLERIGFAVNLAAIAIENRSAQQELERRAYSDYLTGLANRRYFIEQAESELARTLRYGKELSILMLDVDHFKLVNDRYGHKIGDIVLQKLAEVCRETLRDVDIIGRLGGEEFAVLLPETEIGQAMDVAERLRAAIAAAQVVENNGMTLVGFTVSIGVTTFNAQDAHVDTLLNRADQALYQAKNMGRNRVFKME